jgi:hypothetical protein
MVERIQGEVQINQVLDNFFMDVNCVRGLNVSTPFIMRDMKA